MHDGYIHGLISFKFNDKELGMISEDSVDWGGDEASQVKIWAAQKRNAPVKTLLESAGTNELTFDLIELKPENLKDVMGGTIAGTKWNAPTSVVVLEGPVYMKTADGTIFEAPRAALLAKPKGKLVHNDVFKVNCKLTILDAGEKSPYSMDQGVETVKAGK